MKSQLSSIEVHYLVKELQSLVGAKVDKVFHPVKEELIITLHKTGVGKQILHIVSGVALFLAKQREPASEPSNFCLYLRKQLSNARIKDIKQLQPERIVQITFELKEGTRELIIELFGGGNIILVDQGIIQSAIEYHKFKDRTIRPKETYEYPQKDKNLFEISDHGIKNLLTKSEKSTIATSLAVELGVGGTFSEEICLRAEIDKKEEPKASHAAKIHDALQQILNLKLEPNDGEEALPVKLLKYPDQKEATSFSELIEARLKKEKKPKKSAKQIKLEKIDRIVESQEKQIKQFEKQAEQSTEKAELLYANYQMISDLLKELKEIEKKHSWHEIKKKLKGHKLIKEVNATEKKIVIEL